MKRIICHWSAGSYVPSALDKQHYHYLIDGDGEVHRGFYAPEDNLDTRDGRYAAHTRHLNRDSIGIALCAMAGATEKDFGRFPIKQAQWDALVKLIRNVCEEYNIPVSRKTVLSHAEVQITLAVEQRGKWDISVSPLTGKFLDPLLAGDQLRMLVTEAAICDMPTLYPSNGSYPNSFALHVVKMMLRWKEVNLIRVKEFQRINGLDDDGIIGPKTWAVMLGLG